ncbi:MAG: hypothetical protein KDK70_11890 [Myxococcales bacterium]|nr:hypothetical protein [Myxococcales bacterium]
MEHLALVEARARRSSRWAARIALVPLALAAALVAALAAALAATLAAGCGIVPDPQIAEEFHERLLPRDRAWAPVPCKDRAAKVERLRGLEPLALDLRARIREFETPPPPQLLERIMAFPMRGQADDYRCVVQDFTRIDLSTEPDYEGLRDLAANLYVLKGMHLLDHGAPDEGWAHVLDALRLYRRPVAPGVDRHLTLIDVLRAVDHLLDTHPPPPAILDALIETTDAAALTVPTICTALRHDLLIVGMMGFRVHFGQREREAVARRYGLDFAMRTWRTPQQPGTHDRPAWAELRQTYDLMVPECAKHPLGHSIQRAALPMVRLEMVHPRVGLPLRVVANRLNQAGLLSDVHVTLRARLRGQRLRQQLGRDPTTAELAVSFGRRPINPWDGRRYTFVVTPGQISVVRGPYRHVVSLDPVPPAGSGTSYPRLPAPTR